MEQNPLNPIAGHYSREGDMAAHLLAYILCAGKRKHGMLALPCIYLSQSGADQTLADVKQGNSHYMGGNGVFVRQTSFNE